MKSLKGFRYLHNEFYLWPSAKVTFLKSETWNKPMLLEFRLSFLMVEFAVVYRNGDGFKRID